MSNVWQWEGPNQDDAGERRWRRKETWPTRGKQPKRKVKTLKSGDMVQKDRGRAYKKLVESGSRRSKARNAKRNRSQKYKAHDRHYSNVKHQRPEVMRNKERATGGLAYNKDSSVATPRPEAGVARANRALKRYQNFDEVPEVRGMRQTEFGKALNSAKGFADLVKVYGQAKAERLVSALSKRGGEGQSRYVMKASLGLPPGAAPAAPGAGQGQAAAGGGAAGPQAPSAPSANQAAPAKPKKTLKPKAK